MTALGDRVYRALLRAFPASVREADATDMAELFRQQRRTVAGRPLAAAWLWIRGASDLLWHGGLERLGASCSVTQGPEHAMSPTSSSSSVISSTSRGGGMNPSGWFGDFGRDARVATRRLRAAPGFALVALLTLALGIGATTAIFSVVYGVLLKPLPFPQPDRLVGLFHVWEGKRDVLSPPNFMDLESRAHSFSSVGASSTGGVTLTNAGEPARLIGEEVTDGYFATLGTPPMLGRVLGREDNEKGHSHVAVLSHALWRTRFGSDMAIVNRTITLDGESSTVVGVMPASFTPESKADLWTPFTYDENFTSTNRGAWFLDGIGRLKPGVTLAAADAEVSAIAKRLEQEYPKYNEKVGMTAYPLLDAIIGDTKRALTLMLGAVALVLLIACVNVANLLLARAASREGELAVRAALGAGRARLIRELLAESLLLATIGGAAGLGLAYAGTRALVAFGPAGVPRLSSVTVDGGVALFAVFCTLTTGLLFGVIPAVLASNSASADALRERGRSAMSGVRGRRVRSVLVVAELALAVLLLIGAGLLVRSFSKLVHVDPGFNASSALTFTLGLPDSVYKTDPAREVFHQRLIGELGAMPGVTSVAEVQSVPPSAADFNLTFGIRGRPPLPLAQQPVVEVRIADANYFSTMGIRVLRGRAFTDADRAGTTRVMLITEATAHKYFPGADPLGQHMSVGWKRDGHVVEGDIVGVVADVKTFGLDREVKPQVYFPYAQVSMVSLALIVRTAVPPETLFASTRAAVARVDPNLPINKLETLEAHVARSLASRRFYMTLLAMFAGVALVLAAIGIFGVLLYLVSQRTREIGIRVALGASRGSVVSLIVRQAAVLSAVGVSVGLAGAFGLSRYLTAMLFELSPTDAATFVLVAVALMSVALFAAWIPARRALRIEPVIALRAD